MAKGELVKDVAAAAVRDQPFALGFDVVGPRRSRQSSIVAATSGGVGKKSGLNICLLLNPAARSGAPAGSPPALRHQP